MRSLFLMCVAMFALAFVSGCDDGDEGPSCGDGECAFDEWGVCPEDCHICGDTICDETETMERCPEDCSVCNDGTCTDTEMAYGCISDCYPCINLIWGAIVNCIPENCGYFEDIDYVCAICGDGVCEPLEDRSGCVDCAEPECGDGECQVMEWGTCEDCADDCCGDGFCGTYEEMFYSCPQDCDECGDGVCDTSETDFCNVDCRPFEM